MPKIPDSFPLDPWPAALSGAQPKLAVRLIDGKYVTGLTDSSVVDLLFLTTKIRWRRACRRRSAAVVAGSAESRRAGRRGGARAVCAGAQRRAFRRR